MLNKIMLMGRITADLTLKQTNSGKEYVNFTVAVDQFAKGGESKADFFRCTAWGKTAVFIERYFRKGAMILIEGSMHNDNYKDNNGVTHYGMNVRVTSAYFTGERTGSEAEPADDEPEE
jgi:single-strand DNA-binding protein